MTKLVENYKEMKLNFNDLMSYLQNTNTTQEKIIDELKNLKTEKEGKEERLKVEAENKIHKREVREK